MKVFKRTIAVMLATLFVLSAVVFSSGAVQTYDQWVSANYEKIDDQKGFITLTPGTDKTQMNFSWQSSMWKKSANLYISEKADMSNYKSLSVSHSLHVIAFEYTHEATATNLKADTTYYYKYKADNKWSSVYSFKTGSADDTRVLFVTDPQIGRSSGSTSTVLKHDTYGWTSTVETAIENTSNIDFMISAGDQVETSSSEKQYTMFESVPALRSMPIAAAIGNHDCNTSNYSYHFNNPNDNTSVSGKSSAGNGYYFNYNDILFIVLDSNNTKSSAQESIISAACSKYPNTQWRVVVMHHSPYDANADKYSASVATRTCIAPYLDKYNIDICLSGHDHYYSRSHIISGNTVTLDTPVNGVYTNPSGVLYVSGNSASGSNYYDIDKTAVSTFCDFYYQTMIPGYSIVDFNNNELSVKTYETSTNSVIDQVAIVKN